MEEEILLPETEDIQEENEEVNENIPVVKILKKRIGNKLLLANKGCGSFIGCIEQINSKFFIEGYLNEFNREQEAIDFLLYNMQFVKTNRTYKNL